MTVARSWLPLLLVVVMFLAALTWQRSRSRVLAAEARGAEVRDVAGQLGLPVPEGLALLELLGPDLAPAVFATQAQRFAALRTELGHPALGVLAVRGKRALAERLRDAAHGDPGRVRALVFETREAVEDAVRFLSVTERFAARIQEAGS
ncbi:MAG: hypothetical protein AAF628_07335 [Planctomycetota bacterium]